MWTRFVHSGALEVQTGISSCSSSGGRRVRLKLCLRGSRLGLPARRPPLGLLARRRVGPRRVGPPPVVQGRKSPARAPHAGPRARACWEVMDRKSSGPSPLPGQLHTPGVTGSERSCRNPCPPWVEAPSGSEARRDREGARTETACSDAGRPTVEVCSESRSERVYSTPLCRVYDTGKGSTY